MQPPNQSASPSFILAPSLPAGTADHGSHDTADETGFAGDGGHGLNSAADGEDLAAMDQDAAAAYKRYNPLRAPMSGAGGTL